MPTFSEIQFRDCAHCNTASVQMVPVWSSRLLKDAGQNTRPAVALACRRCAGLTVVSLHVYSHPSTGQEQIHDSADVMELDVMPKQSDLEYRVEHLPDDVSTFFLDAQKALRVGLADSAAVQLRKTLEAAAAHKGVEARTLVDSIRKLVEAGHVTVDFKDVLTHVRKVGNAGAHATSERLTEAQVLRTIRFTAQVLRNLFEVPGELALLADEDAVEGVDGTSYPANER